MNGTSSKSYYDAHPGDWFEVYTFFVSWFLRWSKFGMFDDPNALWQWLHNTVFASHYQMSGEIDFIYARLEFGRYHNGWTAHDAVRHIIGVNSEASNDCLDRELLIELCFLITEYPSVGEYGLLKHTYWTHGKHIKGIRPAINRALMNSPYAERWVADLVADELCPSQQPTKSEN